MENRGIKGFVVGFILATAINGYAAYRVSDEWIMKIYRKTQVIVSVLYEVYPKQTAYALRTFDGMGDFNGK
jgi:hypothetical protein